MEIIKGFNIANGYSLFSSANVEEKSKRSLIKTVFLFAGIGCVFLLMGIYFSYFVLSNYNLFTREYPYVLFFYKSLNRIIITYFVVSAISVVVGRFFPEKQVLNLVGIFLSSFIAGIFIFFPIRGVVIFKNLANISNNIYLLLFFFTIFMIFLPFVIALFSKTSFNIGLNSLITIIVGVFVVFMFDFNFVQGFRNWIFTSAFLVVIFQVLVFFIFNMILKSDVYEKCPAAASLLLLNCITGILISILFAAIALIILLGLLYLGASSD